MGILVDIYKENRVVIQGITGRMGELHSHNMRNYGTDIVAGVTPGKGGQWALGTIPIFNTVKETVETLDANTSVVFVPPRFAPDAIMEAAEAGIKLIVCVTEGIPVLDMIKVNNFVQKTGTRLIGPNAPGLIDPARKLSLGIMSTVVERPGPVGIVSRSRTLTYEIIWELNKLGIGQSTVAGIGGDPVIGSSYIDFIKYFNADENTKHIALIGEIGGGAEQAAAAYLQKHLSKPIAVFLAGRTAPAGVRLGDIGAIIENEKDTVAHKIAAFEAARIPVFRRPAELAQQIKAALS